MLIYCNRISELEFMYTCCFVICSLQKRGKGTKKKVYTQARGRLRMNFCTFPSIFTHQNSGDLLQRKKTKYACFYRKDTVTGLNQPTNNTLTTH